MTDTCREFGISRKAGYKIFTRHKESGFEALSDPSRRSVRYANQLPPQIETLIVTLKREKPHRGACERICTQRTAFYPCLRAVHAAADREPGTRTPDHGYESGGRQSIPQCPGAFRKVGLPGCIRS